MKKYLLLFMFIPFALFAQNETVKDSLLIAMEADFFHEGRQYQSVFPIIEERQDWKAWETQYGWDEKLARVAKVKGEEIINFIYEYDSDESGNPIGDTLNFGIDNIHFLDYNNDGFEDLIFEQKINDYAGHKVKMYLGDGEYYHLDTSFSGMIVAMGKDKLSGALWFTLYNYPCCDGYVHSLSTYWPAFFDGTVKHRITKTEKFVELNGAHGRWKNLPHTFDQEIAFRTKFESVVLFKSRSALYRKYIPRENFKPRFKNYFPFASIPENTSGVILNETVDISSTGSDTLVFVKLSAKLDKSQAIEHLLRKAEGSEVTYYGWMDKGDLVVED